MISSSASLRVALATPGRRLAARNPSVALLFALYHTVTWFLLTGVVQVVHVGDQQVPPALIVAGAFAAWVVVSLFLLYWIVVRS